MSAIKKDFQRKPDLNTLVYGKVPPQAIELEEAVLGACMLERETFDSVLEIIKSEEVFYSDAHQKIYGCMLRLRDNGQQIDLLTITDGLRKTTELEIIGGAYYLTRLTMSVMSSAHVESHARIVFEKFIQREIIRIGGDMIKDAYEDFTDPFELLENSDAELKSLMDGIGGEGGTGHLAEGLPDLVNRIEQMQKNEVAFTGVDTGLTELNSVTKGLQNTDMIILAARPGTGKTALMLNIAIAACTSDLVKKVPVGIFSLEMGKIQLLERIVAALTETPLEIIKSGRMSESELKTFILKITKLQKLPIYIDDRPGLSIAQIRAKTKMWIKKYGVGLICGDYLTLMKGMKEHKRNREEEVSYVSRELKGQAKEFGVPYLILAQLNRAVEGRSVQIPKLSDLRESGAIEQDADLIMFLYETEGKNMIGVAKHRNGASGVEIEAKFIKYIQKWVDLHAVAKIEKESPNPYAGMPTGYAKHFQPPRNPSEPQTNWNDDL